MRDVYVQLGWDNNAELGRAGAGLPVDERLVRERVSVMRAGDVLREIGLLPS